MKLLNVEVVLNREKDIQGVQSEYDVLRELDDEITSYAILSHRWGAEVGYEEMTGLMKMEEGKRDEVRQRCGYQKIIKSCEQATKDGHKWLWIDTCCIDKRSSSELSEAISSMYRWYQNAQVCYAYLNDVCESIFPTVQDNGKFDQSNGWPEWFMRGWTLQELVAPKQVEFFNKDWVSIGNKRRLAPALEDITRIPRDVLTGGLAAKRLSVAQIMSWAAHRKTTRVEDRAYSLMGLFGVNMPMLYGEGRKAFRRLQLEIIRELSDHSIFAWRPWIPRAGSVLAEDPSDFLGCGDVENVEPDDFADTLIKEYIERNGLNDESSRSDFDSRARHQHKLAVLRSTVNLQQFRTFIVNNAGIEVLLPVIPFRDSPSHFRAILACRSGFLQTSLVTIDLVCSGSSFSRTSVDFSLAPTYPDFKTLHLIHHQGTNVTRREFQLDDMHASYHGFTRCGTYPRGFRGDAVTLSSLSDDLIVIVYANNDVRSRFAVGLGYYLGQGWVHVCYDESSPAQEEDWTDFVSRAYDRMWKARAKHAQSMPKRQGLSSDEQGAHFVKHTHLPRSIWAARVVWGRWECDNFKVMVDVKQCPGCCDGPRRWTATSHDRGGLGMPGPMKTISDSYSLILDGWKAQFDKYSGQRIVLGDYGSYRNGSLIRKGNVFDDMRALGIDPEDSAYCPVISHVSGSNWLWSRTTSADDLTMVYSNWGTRLALQQPKGISLPANEHFVLLLKALSTRLAGKHLVITIIQCSDFYEVDGDGKRKDLGDDSAPASSNQFQEAGIATPLFTIATPQVWTREWPCEQRRERFESIRKRFYALVNMDQPPGSAPSRKSASRQKKIRTINSFSNMFGLHRLRNYIGKITFFARFFQVIEPDPSGDVLPVGATEGWTVTLCFPENLHCIIKMVYQAATSKPTVHSQTRALKLCYLYCTGGIKLFAQ
ncbi:hypothetical protein EV401DRAFT_534262 [Pisolithus croceorrhizus]|nr:hypothetical protein EV401DRAFT_534262 [Pisolithus croceorrhizus]